MGDPAAARPIGDAVQDVSMRTLSVPLRVAIVRRACGAIINPDVREFEARSQCRTCHAGTH